MNPNRAMTENEKGRESEVPNGVYSTPRKCSGCDFTTLSRDEFWQHRAEAHGEFNPAPPEQEER